MNLDFARLDDDGIREAAAHNYPMWGGRRTLDEHVARVLECGRRLGMRYMGLREPGGRLLAALKLYGINLSVEGERVPAAGIGAVHVAESERGKGYGKEIVRKAIEHAPSLGAAALLLYSDIDPRFYEELGFARLDAWNWSASASAIPDAAPYRVRTAVDGDLSALLEWHAAARAPFAVAVDRMPGSWGSFRWFRGPSEDLVLSDEEREVGYVTVDSSTPELEILEWFSPDPRRFWATVGSIAARHDAATIHGWASSGPHEPWMNVRPREGAIPMLALPGRRLPAEASSWFSAVDHF